MKTTLELSDAVLERAKSIAARDGLTLRAVVEDALRSYLEDRDTEAARPRQFRIKPWGKGGLRPEHRDRRWSDILAEVNDRPLPDDGAG
jgi:hypothetical protein